MCPATTIQCPIVAPCITLQSPRHYQQDPTLGSRREGRGDDGGGSCRRVCVWSLSSYNRWPKQIYEDQLPNSFQTKWHRSFLPPHLATFSLDCLWQQATVWPLVAHWLLCGPGIMWPLSTMKSGNLWLQIHVCI